MHNSLVSVITPCYNAESVISQAIESVFNQTYRNWEMLVIDDCSTDHSAEVIKAYCAKDDRIKYFKTPVPSGSPSLPRNIGLDNANGEFIAFLDADDVWLPEKLEKQISYMTSFGYDFVYSYYEKIDWIGHRKNRIIRTTRQASYKSLLKSNSIPCLTTLIRTSAINNIRFKAIPQEDFCFWLDILRAGKQAYNLTEVTALYRETQGSRSANKFDMFKGHWNVIRKQQSTPLIPCCFYMITYAIFGILKYLK